MLVVSRQFPNGFLILPNLSHLFGERSGRPMRVVHSFECGGVATVHVTEVGAFAYSFSRTGGLWGDAVLEFDGCGEVPAEVGESRERMVALQEARLKFANFVSAALFGRLCGLRHSGLTGAVYNGMDGVMGFAVVGDEVMCPAWEQDRLMASISPKIEAMRSGRDAAYRVPQEQLASACGYVSDVIARSDGLRRCDLRECLAMNYQAAILHEKQHFQASLALNFIAIEVLVDEAFFFHGMVNGHAASAYCRNPPGSTLSSNEFQKLGFDAKVEALLSAGVIDAYLAQRLNEARKKRKDLMHRAKHVAMGESGNCQTVIRDILHLFIEAPFELVAGATYRL